MPKILIHAPEGAFDAADRPALAAELTNFALACEALPASPFVKSTVWTYFASYPADAIFMGAEQAYAKVVSTQIFVIEGGLDNDAKKKLIAGATEILGRHLGVSGRVPVYIVIHEVPETSLGLFGNTADLAALRAAPLDAPAL